MSHEDAPAAAKDDGELPLFPLHTVLFPGGPLPLRLFEPRYLDMVRRCLREKSAFGVVQIATGSEAGAVASTADVGTSAQVVDFSTLPDGLLGITCLGERRFRIVKRRIQGDGLNVASVDWLDADAQVPFPELYDRERELLRRLLPRLGDLYRLTAERFDDASWVGCRLAEILPISLAEKQECLELSDPVARLQYLGELLRREK